MILKTVIDELKAIKPKLQRDYQVEKIGYFGSFARGTASDTSDLDLLVEFKNPIGWNFFKLESFLEKRLNRKIDLVTRGALKDQLSKKIIEEVIFI
jgi:uncharacterized protein